MNTYKAQITSNPSRIMEKSNGSEYVLINAEMLEGPAREVGVRIDSINLEKEDNNLYLRIVIDRDEIIDIDKCVEVTNIINPILDREDPIKESYTLDVSTKEKGR